jgi:hypothetical protein|tara:strand:- start:4017 stop:4163 length:147 start_codon:yes stop_codon:yes gene_type:complete
MAHYDHRNVNVNVIEKEELPRARSQPPEAIQTDLPLLYTEEAPKSAPF